MKGSAGNPRALCERLREAMNHRGIRAVDLSEKTGIPKGAISYYMSGKSRPKADRRNTSSACFRKARHRPSCHNRSMREPAQPNPRQDPSPMRPIP